MSLLSQSLANQLQAYLQSNPAGGASLLQPRSQEQQRALAAQLVGLATTIHAFDIRLPRLQNSLQVGCGPVSEDVLPVECGCACQKLWSNLDRQIDAPPSTVQNVQYFLLALNHVPHASVNSWFLCPSFRPVARAFSDSGACWPSPS